MLVRYSPFGLDVDLPLAAEPVEVVDETAPHEALQDLIDVAIGTPCFSTLSRSTSTKSCGTVGRKVVVTLASSGRFLAASMNF